jgi:hypothetical protein
VTGFARTGAGPQHRCSHRTGAARGDYEPDAPQNQPVMLDQFLAEHRTDGKTRPARLLSARLIDGAVRWYDEVGVVVHAPPQRCRSSNRSPLCSRSTASWSRT